MSQLYSTMFGVFGRFLVEEGSTADGMVVNGLELTCINYKGPINMKLTTESEDSKEIKVEHSDTSKPHWVTKDGRRTLLMELWVEPSTEGLDRELKDYKLDLTPYNLGEFKKGDRLRIERKLNRLNSVGNAREKAFFGGVFDNEFFVRDGLYIKKSDNAGALLGDGVLFTSGDLDMTFQGKKITGNKDNSSFNTASCTPANHVFTF
ncbi:MAG: hypothetical protein AAF696_36755 [Bacteroidota bacterium]